MERNTASATPAATTIHLMILARVIARRTRLPAKHLSVGSKSGLIQIKCHPEFLVCLSNDENIRREHLLKLGYAATPIWGAARGFWMLKGAAGVV